MRVCRRRSEELTCWNLRTDFLVTSGAGIELLLCLDQRNPEPMADCLNRRWSCRIEWYRIVDATRYLDWSCLQTILPREFIAPGDKGSLIVSVSPACLLAVTAPGFASMFQRMTYFLDGTKNYKLTPKSRVVDVVSFPSYHNVEEGVMATESSLQGSFPENVKSLVTNPSSLQCIWSMSAIYQDALLMKKWMAYHEQPTWRRAPLVKSVNVSSEEPYNQRTAAILL